jgi:hypothetical protein
MYVYHKSIEPYLESLKSHVSSFLIECLTLTQHLNLFLHVYLHDFQAIKINVSEPGCIREKLSNLQKN